MSLSLEELEKAVVSLEKALELYKDSSENQIEIKKAFRDACIQRFEYCIEMSWKQSMKVLGSNTMAAKPAIREMARNNLIDNPELWFDFIESRNETSHSYDEDIAIKVFTNIKRFYPEVRKLLQTLQKQI
ncbi:MAG: nucleotidyltransferase substrate binding protein [Bacteriovorax sp.]|nr:nucleotidyltransferase substrate binding protein [Bacteriovorax sp.]